MASNFGTSLPGKKELKAIEASGGNEDKAIEASSSDGQTGSDQNEKAKHRFSAPWEDSDLVLVVEDEKFHVHRLILSMTSPVFKTMFKSQFKEATSSEIPLPDKKANGLSEAYLLPIYRRTSRNHKVENVEYLLKLSDEYQVKHIFDSCIKFIENEPKTKENVMKLREMAEMYNSTSAREACDKNMKLNTLSKTIHVEDLDRENLRHFLEQRIERLETFLDNLYPEFMGMVESAIKNFYKIKYEVSTLQKSKQ